MRQRVPTRFRPAVLTAEVVLSVVLLGVALRFSKIEPLWIAVGCGLGVLGWLGDRRHFRKRLESLRQSDGEPLIPSRWFAAPVAWAPVVGLVVFVVALAFYTIYDQTHGSKAGVRDTLVPTAVAMVVTSALTWWTVRSTLEREADPRTEPHPST